MHLRPCAELLSCPNVIPFPKAICPRYPFLFSAKMELFPRRKALKEAFSHFSLYKPTPEQCFSQPGLNIAKRQVNDPLLMNDLLVSIGVAAHWACTLALLKCSAGQSVALWPLSPHALLCFLYSHTHLPCAPHMALCTLLPYHLPVLAP